MYFPHIKKNKHRITDKEVCEMYKVSVNRVLKNAILYRVTEQRNDGHPRKI